jgi:hypothetical protein
MAFETGWRYCCLCNGFVYTTGNAISTGKCPASSTGHSVGPGTSGWYGALKNTGFGFTYTLFGVIETTWCWCQSCQGLWYWDGSNYGSCPANNGGGHSRTGSPWYTEIYNAQYFTAVGGFTTTQMGSRQVGWRWCDRCQVLFFGNGQNKGGACPKGGLHSSPAGYDYSVYFATVP